MCRIEPQQFFAIKRHDVRPAIPVYVGSHDVMHLVTGMFVFVHGPRTIWCFAQCPWILEPSLVENEIGPSIAIHVQRRRPQPLINVRRITDQVLHPHRVGAPFIPPEAVSILSRKGAVQIAVSVQIRQRNAGCASELAGQRIGDGEVLESHFSRVQTRHQERAGGQDEQDGRQRC